MDNAFILTIQQSFLPSGEMKGALLYDPLVGRFLSADNVIQDPTSTQNYNRYSYCLNNPQKYVDPSGYRMALADEYRNLGAENTQWYIPPHQRADNGGADGGWGGGASSGGWGGIGGALPNWSSGGYHYDSSAGAYTNNAGDIVGWNTISNSISPYTNEVSTLIYNGTTSNPYLRLVGWDYADGSSFYYSDGGNLGGSKSGGGNSCLNTLNSFNTWAGTVAFAMGKILSDTRIGSDIGYLIAYKSIGNATKYIKPVGVGTSIVGAIIGGYKFSGTENKTWGVYGQLGVSLLSSGLTLSGVTAPVGIGIGVIDVFGGFNGFYNYLDNQQQFYNSSGGLLIPLNGIPSYLQLNRK